MKTSNVEKLLGKGFCERNKIDPAKEYEIEYAPARSLLTYDRIDVLAKLLSIEAYAAGLKTGYYDALYAAHIEAFSRGTYTERDQEDTKNSLALYVDCFHKLYQNIKANGFHPDTSVVPVGADNAILDGAHRTACAALLNLEIPIIRFQHIPLHCGFHFFEERLLSADYLDFLAYQYCRFDQHTYLACFWPLENGQNQQPPDVESLPGASCAVIWKRTVALPRRALQNAVSSLSWSGQPESHPSAAAAHADTETNRSVSLTLMLLACKRADDWLSAKGRLADSFRAARLNALISDTHEQAVEMAQTFFSRNTRRFFEAARPDRSATIQRLLAELKTAVREKGVSPESFVVSGGAVPALYGLGDADALSLVFDSKTAPADGTIARCACSSPEGADDLVHNPNSHFWYRGFKFVTASKLAELKKSGVFTGGDCTQAAWKQLERIAARESKRPVLEDVLFKFKKAKRNLKYKIYPAILKNPVTDFLLKCYHFIRHRRWF